MNEFLLALIGLLAIFVVGMISYGVLFKGQISDGPALSINRFLTAGVVMYIISYFFVVMFQGFEMADASNTTKGLLLGLMTGTIFFALPLIADVPYLKGKQGAEWMVAVNWILSFTALGLVVGLLI